MQDVAFKPFEGITYKPMHGALQVFKKKLPIAVIKSDGCYLFVDKLNRPKYNVAKAKQYSFTKKSGKLTVTDFYLAPDWVISSSREFGQWVSDSIQAAERKVHKLDQ
jgi:TfoX/Sxy family transcriptional regulator of competence genes